MTIAIICARGGSKRLPRKNVRPFCGVPLVAWSIIQAKCAHGIDEVCLSTDDDEIEAVGREYGAEIIRRPDWPDADLCAASRPSRHAVGVLLEKYGDDFENIVSILPTTPLRRPNEFDRAIALYNLLGLSCVLTVTQQRETLIYFSDHQWVARTTLLDKSYTYLGQGTGWSVQTPYSYLGTTDLGITRGRRKKVPSDLDADLDTVTDMSKWPSLEINYILVPHWANFECDTLEEFELAEVVFRHFICGNQGAQVYYDYAKEEPEKIEIKPDGSNLMDAIKHLVRGETHE